MFKVRAHKPYPLSWWCKQEQNIDTTPKYQRRGRLWSASKQAGLIDSILNEFDMPKLYFADFTGGATALKVQPRPYAVIDGKQRMEAIFAFFKDQLPLNSDFVFFDDPKVLMGGLRYSELRQRHPEIALRFDRHVPTVMSVFTDDELKITELFVRLNTGVAANSAERRNAMPGLVSDQIRSIAKHAFFRNNISFDKKRMAENNVAAKLLLIEYQGRFVDTKAANLDRFARAKYADEEVKRIKTAAKAVTDVLGRMAKGFDEQERSLGAAGSIPIYYWLYRNNPSHDDLLPEFVRQFAKSVKDNLALSRTMPDKADPLLSQYYTMGRTTNDQASLMGRAKLIQDLFEAHILDRPKRRA
jgi:hypothetical protein